LRSESGPRGRNDTVRSRAAPGIMSAGITTGAWGAATGLGQESAGNARADRVPGNLAWSRKSGVKASARAAVERRKASASRWTRGRARSANRWQHLIAWRGPTGQLRLFGAPPPLIFWRQKLGGFGRQNSAAKCVARTGSFASSAPAIAGEGDHWSSRSERTVVEGAQDSELRCRCGRFCSREDASERKCSEITNTLAAR
jgi:hypothetical protein